MLFVKFLIIFVKIIRLIIENKKNIVEKKIFLEIPILLAIIKTSPKEPLLIKPAE
jgi:hypothetical protein